MKPYRGPEEELAYIDETVRVEVDAWDEDPQKTLERFLLAVYDREYIEGFLGTKKKNK